MKHYASLHKIKLPSPASDKVLLYVFSQQADHNALETCSWCWMKQSFKSSFFSVYLLIFPPLMPTYESTPNISFLSAISIEHLIKTFIISYLKRWTHIISVNDDVDSQWMFPFTWLDISLMTNSKSFFTHPLLFCTISPHKGSWHQLLFLYLSFVLCFVAFQVFQSGGCWWLWDWRQHNWGSVVVRKGRDPVVGRMEGVFLPLAGMLCCHRLEVSGIKRWE